MIQCSLDDGNESNHTKNVLLNKLTPAEALKKCCWFFVSHTSPLLGSDWPFRTAQRGVRRHRALTGSSPVRDDGQHAENTHWGAELQGKVRVRSVILGYQW